MFYLNGTQIDEPIGWTGVYWTRVRHTGYFGIWRHRTAKVLGVGEVGFTGEARSILLSLWKKHRINASAIFEVEEGGEIIYQGEVDFAIHSDDGRYFKVSFRDEDTELESLSGLTVSIEPKIEIRFPEQTISDGIAYSIADGLSSPFYVSGTQHSIPLASSKNGEGNGLSVSTQSVVEPIYRNSTDRKAVLTLQGKVIGMWSGSGNVNFVAEVTQDGAVKDSRTLTILSASGSQQDFYISDRIEVPQGAYLRVTVVGSAGMTASYSTESFLTIYENSNAESSLIWGLTWKQAFEALVEKLTNGTVTVSSDFLTKGNGASRVLTSERNLRGYRSPLLVSFKSLFDDFNAIENLACWKRDGKLYLETKADMVKKLPRSRVYDYEKLEHAPSPFFHSTCEVGYANWQSETAAGRDEFCTSRSYITNQQKIKSPLSVVVNSLSAAGKAMEVLRRNPSSDKADTNQDERLFVIEAQRTGNVYVAKIGDVSGVLNAESVINASLSPRQILKRWANVLGINGKASFAAGTGNYSASTFGEVESSDVDLESVPQVFSDRSVMIETEMTMRQYSQMGEVIEYTDHDGETRAALVNEDTYRFSSGKVSIQAIQLTDEYI
ncbi:hypothetical protein GCM10007423_39910 [Dyadobacter endophyticus]|uniref:Uncharacterized protein n=1 Tax=Dyadobacter endophyticus TaxID=1749036 RepID=A0ABQ1YY21_9BACT|nr:hypothetical protein [Dyadobacter endophyticus]GGH42918.1 hypothetical protein GCM10007423_39910 [Dyadobacter endophyticus]